MEAKKRNLKVVKTAVQMFLDPVVGQVAPEWLTDIKKYTSFIPAKGSNPSYEVNLSVNIEGESGTYSLKISPRLLGASPSKMSGPSQWDLFVEAIHAAGVDWSIKGLTCIIDGRDIKSSNGEELDWGFKRIKLTDQDDLEFDLLSGRSDTDVFGKKFGFIKGLSQEVKETRHSGLNSTVCIQQRKKPLERTKRGKPDRTRTGGSSNAVI